MNKETSNKPSAAAMENRLVSNEWKAFSRTTAYRKLMEYIDIQDQMTIMAAKGPVTTFDEESGTQLPFNRENAVSLLQRSVGYDIVKTYVEGYVEYTTPEA